MAGYGARNHPSEGVLRDLYVKALALESEPGQPSVIVTADILGFPREVSEVIAARCEKQFGLSRDRLMLNASHTHSGPVVHRNAFSVLDMDEKQAQVVDRYSGFLVEKTVVVVGAALRGLAPASLKFEQGLAGIAVNRRRARPNSRGLPGPVDHDVPVIAIQGTDGSLRAVLVGYACHATVLSFYQISGDWPGFAQEEIEKAHPGAIALFVQGCGADSNPLPRRTVKLARSYGQTLSAAVDEVLKSRMRPVEGPLRTAFDLVQLPFHHVPTRAELVEMLPRQRGARWRDILDHGGTLPDQYPFPVQVWQFGRSLKLIALSGEVVTDYALRLKGQYGWDDTWVAGYSNDLFGYTPSARVLREGDYEAVNSGFPMQFSPAIEELIVEKVSSLMERTSGQQRRPPADTHK